MRKLGKFLFSFVLTLFSVFSYSQYKVTFIVSQLPPYHKSSNPVYLVGNFNRWNPANEQFRLKPLNGKIGITIELPKGMFEYKFTTGSWDKAEVAEGGTAIDNRIFKVEGDTTIEVAIKEWADHFPPKPKKSTANKNVQILDTSFYIPQLNRHRRIWLYLPESYCKSKKTYPVLYMHDGQNVFDDATSYSGEWGVDEALDTLSKQNGEMIVVAIDNGGDKRLNEYSPFDNPQYGKGEGDAYVDFIAHTLIPYINKHYRTKKGKNNTFIAGSSMGGLISFYALLKYPRKFGAAGVFSPAFWIVPQLKEYALERAEKVKGRIYFYAGEQESNTMVPDMLSVFETLHGKSEADMTTVIRAEGKHNESTWRHEFPEFYRWLMKK